MPDLILGWSAVTKRTLDFYQCPQCRHTQESISYGSDELATCYGCDQRIPFRNFGTAKVKRSVAICATCGESVSLTPMNHSWSGPYYVCAPCNNIVAVYCGNHVVSAEQVLHLGWSAGMISRSETLGGWRWTVCRTKKEHLVARVPSVITSKPAIHDHFKTGQRSCTQNMKLFYLADARSGKFCSVSF
jgi:hypothetical protein